MAALSSWVQVFGDESLTDAWIEIETGQSLVFEWTFEADATAAAARVAVGRQASARITGWAKRPRFALWFRRDTPLVDSRVFAEKGEEVDALVGRNGDSVRIQQATSLQQPKSIDADVPCRGLRWGWVSSDGKLTHGKRSRGVPGKRLLLFAEPAVGQPLDLHFAGEDSLVYEVEESGDWVQINFTSGLFFQGWVRGDTLGPTPPGHNSLGSSHRTRAPRVRYPKRLEKIGTVARDTTLYVGKPEAAHEIGVLEQGAIVRVFDANEKLVRIQLDHERMRAPTGKELYADPADITNVQELERGGLWKPPPVVPRNEEAD